MKKNFSYQGVIIVMVSLLLIAYYFVTFRRAMEHKNQNRSQALINSQKN